MQLHDSPSHAAFASRYVFQVSSGTSNSPVGQGVALSQRLFSLQTSGLQVLLSILEMQHTSSRPTLPTPHRPPRRVLISRAVNSAAIARREM